MNWKYSLIVSTLATMAILVTSASTSIEDMEKVEESTESPIADMALIDAELKTSTEKPPTFDITNENPEKTQNSEKSDEKPQSQRHTVADFIIHPLIAFKPRNPEDDSPVGKQAATASTTASPWQLFGFNAGQGLGSSVSSLAGSVTNWLNDRVQLPGLVDTPVRESNNTSTTTTTTQRPDVVVRVQQRPQSSRRPVIRISNRNRPNRQDFDSFEDDDEEEEEEEEDDDGVQQQSQEEDDENYEEESDDDDENDNDNGNDNDNKNNDDDDEEAEDENTEVNDNEESEDDDEEEQVVQRPNNRRRPAQQQPQQQQKKRRVVQQQQQQQQQEQQQRRRQQNRRKANANAAAVAQQRRRQQQQRVKQQQQQNFIDDDDEFIYREHPSMKRSQSQPGFIQLGQQNLLNQIRQLTRGQTPAEIGNTMRTSQNGSNKRRRQQATLFINRNGQTVYVAPELMGNSGGSPQFEYSPNVVVKKRVKPPTANNVYPQPPLTIPYRRKGRPTQYITIPWTQLGISPPNQIISLTEGIQSKPLILNIPQSAINQMQSTNRKKKRPVITSDAVPLLADASLMDIFKPPKIPPSRTGTAATRKPTASSTPIHIVAKPKPNKHTSASALIPQRVRPGTIVEMAPAVDAMPPTDATGNAAGSTVLEDQFILVGNDEEPGLTRQVQPVSGDARYRQVGGAGGIKPYYEVLNRGGGHYALRKTGRALEQQEPIVGIVNSHGGVEEQIPVQVITEELRRKETLTPIVNASVSEIPVVENVAETKEAPAAQYKDKEATAAAAKEVTKVEETGMANVKV